MNWCYFPACFDFILEGSPTAQSFAVEPSPTRTIVTRPPFLASLPAKRTCNPNPHRETPGVIHKMTRKCTQDFTLRHVLAFWRAITHLRRPCRTKAAALGAAGMPRWARHRRPQAKRYRWNQRWARNERRRREWVQIRPSRPQQKRPPLPRAEKGRRRGRGRLRRTPTSWRLSLRPVASRKRAVVVVIQRLRMRKMTMTGTKSPSQYRIERPSSACNATSTSKRSGRDRYVCERMP